MKKNLILVVAFMVMMMSNSCEDIEFINEHSLVGSWKITSFVMNGNDVTEQFSDFIITCDEDGSMIISGNGTIYYCDWEWNDADHFECSFQLHSCDHNSIMWQIQNVWNISEHNENYCNFESQGSMHHNTMMWAKTE